MQAKLTLICFGLATLASCSLASSQQQQQVVRGNGAQILAELERAVLEADQTEAAALAPASETSANAAQQEESYQRVYEAFSKLMQNVSNNSLGNVRRLMARLNRLVGTSQSGGGSSSNSNISTDEERTEQILNRLDRVNQNTDQHTLRQLNEDVGRLVANLNESYLRNIRRLVERVNKVVGQPSPPSSSAESLQQAPDRLQDADQKLPGFPGMDELIVAMDRVQKSFAHFVRSSTRLITSG